MTTRRNFLKSGAAAAVAFCSCGMLHGANAQASRQKLPVMVGGKRVRTIDAAGKTAGPPFEIYGTLKLPSNPPARFAIISERFSLAAKEARRHDLREFVVEHLASDPAVAHAETSLIYEQVRGPGV